VVSAALGLRTAIDESPSPKHVYAHGCGVGFDLLCDRHHASRAGSQSWRRARSGQRARPFFVKTGRPGAWTSVL